MYYELITVQQFCTLTQKSLISGAFRVFSNDLKTVNPALAAEFDVSKNNGSVPEEYFPKSGKKVWWLCSKCGHSWAAQIIKRTNGQGDLHGTYRRGGWCVATGAWCRFDRSRGRTGPPRGGRCHTWVRH